jgi:TrmH family RNA methyltransferase
MVEHRETMGQQREASSQDDGRGPIRSAAHPLLKRMGAILAGKERQACVLEGDRLVDDARAGRATIEVVLVAADRESRALELERGGLRVVRVDPELLARKSALRSSPGIAALAAAPRTAGLDELALAPDALLLVIAGVSDPGNLGALARSAEAAGARGLVLLPGTAHPFGDKALRGSMGSLLRLSVAFCESAAEAAAGLAQRGFRLAAAATRGGVSPARANWSGRVALWIGSETGLEPREMERFERLTIPMAGAVESLNITVAAALLLFAAGRAGSIAETAGGEPRAEGAVRNPREQP